MTSMGLCSLIRTGVVKCSGHVRGPRAAAPTSAHAACFSLFKPATQVAHACARARRPDSGGGDLQERLARDAELQRALAVSQRVGRLLLKAEAGELALVDELAAELLQSESRCAATALTAAALLGPKGAAGSVGPASHKLAAYGNGGAATGVQHRKSVAGKQFCQAVTV